MVLLYVIFDHGVCYNICHMIQSISHFCQNKTHIKIFNLCKTIYLKTWLFMFLASFFIFFFVYALTYLLLYFIMIFIRRISPSPSGDRDAVRHHVRPARGRYKRYISIQSLSRPMIPFICFYSFSWFLLNLFYLFIHLSIHFFILSFHFLFFLQYFCTLSFTRPYFSLNLELITFFNLRSNALLPIIWHNKLTFFQIC